MCDNSKKLDGLISKCFKLALADSSGYNVCTVCGTRLYWTQMQCGYFYSPHNPGVRFDMKNRFTQCPECVALYEVFPEEQRAKVAGYLGKECLEYLENKIEKQREWNDDEINAEIRKCNLFLTYHEIP